jgi:hypothetical protein
MSNDLKRELITKLRLRYQKSSKKDKSLILNELCANFNYNRKYATRRLNSYVEAKRKDKRGRKIIYSEEAIAHLKKLWTLTDQLCSKNLVAALPEWLEHYPDASKNIKEQIKRMSPSTIDRRLSRHKAQMGRKLRTGTKPGSLLRHVIPIKPHNYNIDRPGFVEADTVAHCGDSMSGEFIWSLTVTDIKTGWTEDRAIWGKGSGGVIYALNSIQNSLPFDLIALNVDNGTEFLNNHLIRYLSLYDDDKKRIELSRSRPYIKNDNCHVEQKNWTHVRQVFGYERFDNKQLLIPMNEIYSKEQSLLQNFFIPQAKLLRKERIGAKYKRTYDKPKTPYQRILECEAVSEKTKEKLKALYKTLNPFELRKQRQIKINNFTKLYNKKSDTGGNENEANNTSKIAA